MIPITRELLVLKCEILDFLLEIEKINHNKKKRLRGEVV